MQGGHGHTGEKRPGDTAGRRQRAEGAEGSTATKANGQPAGAESRALKAGGGREAPDGDTRAPTAESR